MRIADSTRYDAIQQGIQTADLRQFKASQQASSGLRVGAPSDDPVAAAQALRTNGASARVDSYRATIRAVHGDADLAESTLSQATDLMGRAQEIALQGASGNYNAAERADLATEVDQLRQSMLAFANQKGSQGYLFAGSQTDTAPFDATGAFVADDADRQVEIGPNLVATVSTSGAKAFTAAAGGRDILADLDALKTALSNNDVSGVQATVNTLDAGSRQLIAARIDAGLKVARLDASETAHQETQTALANQLQSLVGIDPATAYSRFVQAGQAVDSAVAVSKRMLDTLANSRLG
jgi:flagellar hook-associated protein 3 FlgL